MRNTERSTPFIPTALVAALALGGCTQAESRNASEGSAGASEELAPDRAAEGVDESTSLVLVPGGTRLTFRVDESISTESHEAGDVFTASLIPDAGTSLPPGARSSWVVTRSESDAGDESEALLAFRLESIQVDGEWVPVQGTVTETDLRTESGDSGSESAAKVAVGTAAGAIVGRILGGNTSSTLKGAGVGTAIGAVVALTTKGGSAELTKGSTITVRLDEDVVE